MDKRAIVVGRRQRGKRDSADPMRQAGVLALAVQQWQHSAIVGTYSLEQRRKVCQGNQIVAVDGFRGTGALLLEKFESASKSVKVTVRKVGAECANRARNMDPAPSTPTVPLCPNPHSSRLLRDCLF